MKNEDGTFIAYTASDGRVGFVRADRIIRIEALPAAGRGIDMMKPSKGSAIELLGGAILTALESAEELIQKLVNA